MAVIGFLKFSDFLAELAATSLWGEPVRVQDYHRSRPHKQLPINYIIYVVEAAIEVERPLGGGTHTLVCRFIVGRADYMSNAPGNDERHDRLVRRTVRAADLLRERLVLEGYKARPGLIISLDEINVETDPGDLWSKEALGEPD